MEESTLSQYLEHLPAIFQEDRFLGRFLLAFERILSGFETHDSADPLAGKEGLEQVLDHIQTFFDPAGDPSRGADGGRAPDEFLPWLAGWVATSLREDWDMETRRRFISNIAWLYRKRGTLAGVSEMLHLYTQETVTIEEPDDIPHYFSVELSLGTRDPALLARTDRIARDIIDREKPAHTFYGLHIRYPKMQINNIGSPRLQVGINTVLTADS